MQFAICFWLQDLQTTLRENLGDDVKKSIIYSFYDKAHVNARACFDASNSNEPDQRILIQVLCTSSNLEIKQMHVAYTHSEFTWL